MKSLISRSAAALALFVASVGVVHANNVDLPEPGSMVLSGVALAAAAYFLRKGRKK